MVELSESAKAKAMEHFDALKQILDAEDVGVVDFVKEQVQGEDMAEDEAEDEGESEMGGMHEKMHGGGMDMGPKKALVIAMLKAKNKG